MQFDRLPIKAVKAESGISTVSLLSILDFEFEARLPDKYYHRAHIRYFDSDFVFSEDLAFVMVELPKFTKSLEELETDLDHWLYLFKHLHTFSDIPKAFKREPFMQIFEIAEMINMTEEERRAYQASLKRYRDYHNQMDFNRKKALEEGVEKGIQKGIEQGKVLGIEQGIEQGKLLGMEEGILHSAENSFKLGLSLEIIQGVTAIPRQELLALRETWLEAHRGQSSSVIRSAGAK
ncbi:PD-(D/E)XK nuclease family transposase [Pontibacter sp. G13]|nr:PD-(D/E)XK nuclease family transposase [Pontibacter sp. G13]WNJ17736.1 PD-(D/E)XK nuclease family transposase [Pontibacter sp. G13]